MKKAFTQPKIVLFIHAILFLSLSSCSTEDSSELDNTPVEQGQSITEADKVGLVWSEEFEGNNLDNSTWTYDLGDGSAFGIPGWGKQEVQTYTASSKNLKIANGFLTITAIKENVDGKSYTYARIKSQNKFSFKFF